MSDIIDAEYTEVKTETTDYENINTSKYADETKVNEKSLFSKVKKLGAKGGRELLTDVFWLWYAKGEVPPQYLAVIIGALGYFIAPIDLIPDAIPVAGLLDDAGVLAGAIKALSTNLSQTARDKAVAKVNELLGPEPESEVKPESEQKT